MGDETKRGTLVPRRSARKSCDVREALAAEADPEALQPLDFSSRTTTIGPILDEPLEWTTHALDEMEKDGLDELDCRNVIWAGEDGGCDPEGNGGAWRYRRWTPKIWVVIEFEPCECDPKHVTGHHLVGVTAWRKS